MIDAVNVTNIVVILVLAIISILIIIHLIRVYRESPCGDCATRKECQAFSRKKVLKAYKKACKLEKKKDKTKA